MHDARLEEIFRKKREKYGGAHVYSQPRNDAVNSTIAALRNNEMLFIPIDQNFRTGGIFVTFFRPPGCYTTGPVVWRSARGRRLFPVFY
jgi:lauroyl/myristoyl acyltransferase